jgi:cobalt-zinc-cadmium resistance protein CzcA
MGVNTSDTYVFLKDKSKWPEHSGSRWTKQELISAIKSKLASLIPGQALEISQPIQLRFNEILEGVRADVSMKIFGEDMDKLAETGRQAAEIIKTVPGAGDVEEEIKGKSPVLRIDPKPDALKRLGIAKDNVLTTVESAIGGTSVGSLFEGIMRFPIVVRLSEKDRGNLASISQIPVGAGENLTVPLKELAKIQIDKTYNEIKRDSAKERVAVLINLRGSDTSNFVEQAKAAIEKKLTLPTGYYVEWGGSFKNLESAKQRLMIVVPLALLLVFMMTFMAFRSVTQAAIIFTCVPMSLIGGVLGLMLNGLNFSISAAVGFIALSGVSVLNGIVLVSYFDKLKLDGMSGDALILKGAKMRLRAVIMASLAAAIGFIPMMLSTGSGAEVQRPLASVVVGGLVSATLLTLIVLPILYRIFEHKMKVFKSSMSH